MRALKIIWVFLFLVLMSTSAFSEVHFYVFGKGNFSASTGSEEDYEEGINDFPLASSYQTFGVGFGLSSGKVAFIGFEGHYNMSGKVTLTDPSDNDTVNIDTYKHASGFITIGFNIVRNRTTRFYVNGGGGIHLIAEKLETKFYVSELGYETAIEPASGRSYAAGFGGLGLELYISKTMGVFVGGRYLFYSIAGEFQSALTALVGIVTRF